MKQHEVSHFFGEEVGVFRYAEIFPNSRWQRELSLRRHFYDFDHRMIVWNSYYIKSGGPESVRPEWHSVTNATGVSRAERSRDCRTPFFFQAEDGIRDA